MSEVTREEFDALVTRVNALDGGAPKPDVPPATPTTPDVLPPADPLPSTPSIQLSAVTANISGTSYTLSAVATSSADVQVKYLQIAVRGQRAGDVGFSPNTTLRAGIPQQLTGTAGGRGTFEAYLAYSLDGSAWVDGPKTRFSVPVRSATPDDTTPAPSTPPTQPVPSPAPSGQRLIPVVGRSGIGFNSLVFRQTPKDADAFGTKRDVPVDGFLWFTGRGRWDDFRWGYDRGYREWLGQGRLIVTSMPHAPESEGNEMNQRGANNAYVDQQRALGKYLADAGMNSPTFVVRVDWESNGNWYRWSADRPGGAAALRQAIANYVTNLRAGGLTKARFDLCWNKGPSHAGADFEVFPGAEFIDVVAIDQYDMWSPARSDSDWQREMNKPPSITAVANFAREKGIMWAIDEGGNTHGGQNQGGDNPFYWGAVFKTIQANLDTCAWHNTYDEAGAPASLRHDFDSNPSSFEAYRKLWRPR